MSRLQHLIEQDAAHIRAVDQAAFRLGIALGGMAGFGFGALVGAIIMATLR